MKTLITFLIVFACITSQAQDYERLFSEPSITVSLKNEYPLYFEPSIVSKLISTEVLTLPSYEHENYYHVRLTFWDKVKKPLVVAAVQLTSITLEAWGDAKFDMGDKELGHLLQAASVGVLVVGIPLLELGKRDALAFSVSYAAWRVATFDVAYNKFRGLPRGYVGGTSTWDKSMSQIDPGGRAFIRCWGALLAITINIKEF